MHSILAGPFTWWFLGTLTTLAIGVLLHHVWTAHKKSGAHRNR